MEFPHASSLFYASDVFGLPHFCTEILIPNAQYVDAVTQTQFQFVLIERLHYDIIRYVTTWIANLKDHFGVDDTIFR